MLTKVNIRKRFYLIIAILACAGSFGAGWLSSGLGTATALPPAPIRLTGYQYTSPLISCNLGSVKLFSQDQSALDAIQSTIAKDKNAGDITDASVYFSDFMTNRWATVNGDEKYYPASLGKVPIMMAYYAMAESTSSVLDEENSYPAGSPDLNIQQEIPPPSAIVPGEKYTNEQLIESMIKYSDNDAAEALSTLATPAEVNGVSDV